MEIIQSISILLDNKQEFNTKETMKWLTYNKIIFWSFRASRAINVGNKGLLIEVSASRHKGWILIASNNNGSYIVYLLNYLGKVKTQIEDVCCDILLNVIDNSIEKIPEYKI